MIENYTIYKLEERIMILEDTITLILEDTITLILEERIIMILEEIIMILEDHNSNT